MTILNTLGAERFYALCGAQSIGVLRVAGKLEHAAFKLPNSDRLEISRIDDLYGVKLINAQTGETGQFRPCTEGELVSTVSEMTGMLLPT